MESIFDKTCKYVRATHFTGDKNEASVMACVEQLRIHTTYQNYTKYTLKVACIKLDPLFQY